MRASVGRKIASNIFIQSGFSLNSILSRMAIFGIFPFSAPVFSAAHLRVDNSCVPCGRAYCARWPHRNYSTFAAAPNGYFSDISGQIARMFDFANVWNEIVFGIIFFRIGRRVSSFFRLREYFARA